MIDIISWLILSKSHHKLHFDKRGKTLWDFAGEKKLLK